MNSNIAHIEFYVANGLQAVYFYTKLFGFQLCNITKSIDSDEPFVSYLLKQNAITLIFTSPLTATSKIATYLQKHGDGVKDIAFYSDNVTASFNQALKSGASACHEPMVMMDHIGKYEKATINIVENLTHSFTSRNHQPAQSSGSHLVQIDHVAIALASGQLNTLAGFYERVFNYYISYQQEIKTKYSGMNSLVVSSPCHSVQITLLEPNDGIEKSQISNFLNAHNGPGVQHVALRTNDIIQSTQKLAEQGLEFLTIPDHYYETLGERVCLTSEQLILYKNRQVLIDQDESGTLLQIFSRPLHSRPTFFIELIERCGAKGFGNGNVRALFQAIEKTQVSAQ